MKLISKLMLDQISKEEFLVENAILEIDEEILKGLNEAYQSRNANYVEEFVYLIFAFDVFEKKIVNILNELLLVNWHYKHEDIALALEKISSSKSLDFLYNAIELHPQYLSWDDNYAFEVKCVRAIYYIGKEKAYSYLEKLCNHKNSVIREMAQRQFKKLL